MSRLSRYTSRFEMCPHCEAPSEFMPWLKQKIEAGEISLIAPTSDSICYYIAMYSDLFPSNIRAKLPDRERLLSMLFKDRFHDACVAEGFTMPRTECPLSLEEAMAMAGSLPYPVILKPKSHVVAGLSRGVIVNSPSKLENRFRPYDVFPTHRAVAERHPEQVWPMIQEKLNAAPEEFVSISGMLDTTGNPVAWSASTKDGQWPPETGIGISFRCFTNTEVIEQGVAMARRLIGRGWFELELVFDKKRNCYVPIDLNPRSFGQVTLDIARGNDLPNIWYRIMTGKSIPAQQQLRDDIVWRHSILAPLSKLKQLHSNANWMTGLYNIARSAREPYVDVIHEMRDPLPWLITAVSYLRHARGTMKPLWTK